MKFDELGLSGTALRAAETAGYTEPTPIQAVAIPHIIAGRDILGVARTGTGKTASFTLPMLDILADSAPKARMPRALILEPTRELADQVASGFDAFGESRKFSCALLIGGVSYSGQERLLDRGVDVLIATPGRLIDHVQRGKVLLNGVKFLVIDEADRMLDMGFIPDVEEIVRFVPLFRQTLLFSATMSPEMRKISGGLLANPKEITITPPSTTGENIDDVICVIAGDGDRTGALCTLLRQEDVRNAIVFCNRKQSVQTLFRALERQGFPVAALHGDLKQDQRTEALQNFRDGKIRFLVASDVAARGLDVEDLGHVFNFDVPHHPEDYVHRVGRTARAGKKGRAITLATGRDEIFLKAIEKLVNREIRREDLSGRVAEAPPADAVPAAGDVRPARRTEGGRRPRRGGPPADVRPPAAEAAAGHEAAALPAERAAAAGTRGRTPAGRRTAGGTRDRTPPEQGVSRSGRGAGRRGGGGGDRDRDRDGDGVVGFGDHVPAFLLAVLPRREGGQVTSPQPEAAAPETAVPETTAPAAGTGTV